MDAAKKPQEVALSLQILFLMTIISLAPSFLVLMTCFTRIVIVLAFVRNALGTMQMPPNQVLVGFALFLTFLIMAPIFKKINNEALQPYLKGNITQAAAAEKGIKPLREFMLKQTREKDLALIIKVAKVKRPRTPDDVPTYCIIPAFAMSELKTAFEIGFAIYIPFIVIDMVIATTLMSMGMIMLPPMLISLPFKILLFVMVDGWHLVVRSLLYSFKV
jgi:flagellar biosynthetic protein FliP